MAATGSNQLSANEHYTRGLYCEEKKEAYGIVRRYRSRLIICGNETIRFQKDSFSPVADYTVARLIMCVAIQKGWMEMHFEFDRAFPNEYLNSEISQSCQYTQMNAVQNEGK